MRLPFLNDVLPEDARIVSGEMAPSMRKARRSAAARACCVLLEHGLLTPDLFPARPDSHRPLDAPDEQQRPAKRPRPALPPPADDLEPEADEKKQQMLTSQLAGKTLSRTMSTASDARFLHALEIKPCGTTDARPAVQRLGVITSERLPVDDFELFHTGAKTGDTRVTKLSVRLTHAKELRLDEEEWQQVKDFSQLCISFAFGRGSVWHYPKHYAPKRDSAPPPQCKECCRELMQLDSDGGDDNGGENGAGDEIVQGEGCTQDEDKPDEEVVDATVEETAQKEAPRVEQARRACYDGLCGECRTQMHRTKLESEYVPNLDARGVLENILNGTPGDFTDKPIYAVWTPLNDENEIPWDELECTHEGATLETLKPGALVYTPSVYSQRRLFRYVDVDDERDSLDTAMDLGGHRPELRSAAQQLATEWKDKYDLPQTHQEIVKRLTTQSFARRARQALKMDVRENEAEPLVRLQAEIPQDLFFLSQPPDDEAKAKKLGKQDRSPLYTPLSTCHIICIPPRFVETLRGIPAFLRMLSTQRRARDFVEHFKLPDLKLLHLVTALTAPVTHLGYDYNTFEALGDAVLQILVTVHLYLEEKRYGEGGLSMLRSQRVNNQRLRQLGLQAGVADFIDAEVFVNRSLDPLRESEKDTAQDEQGHPKVRHFTQSLWLLACRQRAQ